ncbi:transmembrane channel-like protein 3 [Aplysia californica]|uniref:Transmembrane channel-like protein 3 n=1 Tax=Aplysia californica TaxID=6500 RepID=A0ABM1VUG5_APLCA|nr:transmembrane channel-like protein 3 [Aplysia californica]
MSENKLRRRGSSRSSRRRRRRRSTHSMTSSYGGMDEDDEMLKMFDNDEDEDDIEINNNHNDDEGDDDENNGDGEKDRIAEELDARRRKLEEALKEEMLLQKIEQCKSLIESVKQQKWKMSRKMKVLSKARSYVEKHEGKLSRSKGYQQRGKQLMKQAMRWWNNVMASLVPWEMRIKRIESHFGSVVASYFIFLRWLLWISVWLAVIPSCFIMIPEMVLGSAHGTTNRKTIPADKEKTAYDLKTIWNAEGVVEYSLLFYGYYGNDGIIGQGYRMPLAYLLTSLTTFAFSFIVVLKRMANNSRQSRLSNKDEQFTFSWKLLTEWDFMIANQETATTKHASITTTFKETILEEQEKAREGKVWLLRSLRVAANVIILLLLALSTYVIQLFVERSREMELKVRNDPNYEAGFWAENELTVIMTLISTIFPNILDLISLMEKYHPRTSLRLMLGR